MEKMTRMSKYKELRESLKNDVVTTEATQTYVSNDTMFSGYQPKNKKMLCYNTYIV